jgi:UDPglucose--hexose-1-phosphate uridylyltransferase
MLCDYVDLELKEGDRVIAENDDWVVLVPFWAIWPFETILAPKNHILRLSDLNSNEVVSLSKILKTLLVKYDSLFQTSFPYSMGWHNSPCGSENYDYWQLHAHFYPPLLRSSNVKKFMVGYEMLAEPQRDITPESSASKLRDTPSIHYKLR